LLCEKGDDPKSAKNCEEPQEICQSVGRVSIRCSRASGNERL